MKFIGQKEAKQLVLPLKKTGQIHYGNALRMDWLEVCPPVTKKLVEEQDLAGPTGRLALEESGLDGAVEAETYVCGNPPYRGSQWQAPQQKSDLEAIFDGRTSTWKSLDYVAGWFMKAADYGGQTDAASAFVATNSICQGRQVDTLWSLIFKTGHEITFAHSSFKWANLASHNAGVTVVIVGISNQAHRVRRLFSIGEGGTIIVKTADNINAYLAAAPNVVVKKASKPISNLAEMSFGNMPNDGGFLLLETPEAEKAIINYGVDRRFIRPFVGSQEFIRGDERKCIWIREEDYPEAQANDWLNARFEQVQRQRSNSDRATTRQLAAIPFRFGEVRQAGSERTIVVPRVSSENRDVLPVGLAPEGTIIGDRNFALYDTPLWNMALIASRLHWIWIATVCVRLRTDFSYSNTLGWNTFPVPTLTEKNKSDLTHCAEDILLAREAHFPATIADLYDPENMPEDLRHAHDRNDEVLERIYIGRRFKNDTERLEKLFDLYTKITTSQAVEDNSTTKAAEKTNRKAS